MGWEMTISCVTVQNVTFMETKMQRLQTSECSDYDISIS